mgnify:CR=1 FL=1
MFRKLLTLDEAKKILKKKFSPKPVGTEQVSLSEAYERILADNIVAPLDVPPFDRATVDGYAVRATDTFGADEDKPLTLKQCGQVSVGEATDVIVKNGTTAEIVTGAPLPKGADAVVMLEYTVQKNGAIFIHRPVSKGENVMKAGSDIRKDETVLKKGQMLSSREIGVIAALGLTRVAVYKRPRVAIISTGAEVVEPGKPLQAGKIYDINAHALSAAVLECGGQPVSFGIVPDEKDKLKTALKTALNSADVVITSGGVSVGPKDLIPQLLDTLGEPGVIVCGIAVRPGKPTTIAVVDGKPVFSLPGHPTSSLLMFHMLVRPIISEMAWRRGEIPSAVKAIAATKIFSARGRRTFIMVNLAQDEAGRFIASPVPLGQSGAITTLAKADGFVEISEKQQFVSAGDEVMVRLLKPRKF